MGVLVFTQAAAPHLAFPGYFSHAEAPACFQSLLNLGEFLAIEQQSYKRNENFIFRKIVEEMILVPIHQDVIDMDGIYTLNELGAFIWETLADSKTREELEQTVLEKYATDHNTVKQDLQSFLAEMIIIGAINEA